MFGPQYDWLDREQRHLSLIDKANKIHSREAKVRKEKLENRNRPLHSNGLTDNSRGSLKWKPKPDSTN